MGHITNIKQLRDSIYKDVTDEENSYKISSLYSIPELKETFNQFEDSFNDSIGDFKNAEIKKYIKIIDKRIDRDRNRITKETSILDSVLLKNDIKEITIDFLETDEFSSIRPSIVIKNNFLSLKKKDKRKLCSKLKVPDNLDSNFVIQYLRSTYLIKYYNLKIEYLFKIYSRIIKIVKPVKLTVSSTIQLTDLGLLIYFMVRAKGFNFYNESDSKTIKFNRDKFYDFIEVLTEKWQVEDLPVEIKFKPKGIPVNLDFVGSLVAQFDKPEFGDDMFNRKYQFKDYIKNYFNVKKTNFATKVIKLESRFKVIKSPNEIIEEFNTFKNYETKALPLSYFTS